MRFLYNNNLLNIIILIILHSIYFKSIYCLNNIFPNIYKFQKHDIFLHLDNGNIFLMGDIIIIIKKYINTLFHRRTISGTSEICG